MLCFRCGTYNSDEIIQCTFCGQNFNDEISLKNKASNQQQDKTRTPFKKGDRFADRYLITRFVEKCSCNFLFQVTDEDTEDTLFLRLIAKNLLQRADDKSNFTQAFKEARRLKHPNIVQLIDFGENQGFHYYTSKYLEGLSLKKIISLRHQKDEGFTSEELLPIFEQVFEAFKYAHKHNWHGGLSPEDIVILPDVLKIINFQQMHSLPLKPFLNVIKTSTAQFHYVAPELRIESSHVDHRVDIYSIGVILMEMLCGINFDGQYSDELTVALKKLPRQLEIILRKAVSEHPDSRYKNSTQMWTALKPALQQLSSSVKPFKRETADNIVFDPDKTEVLQLPEKTSLLPEIGQSQIQLLDSDTPPPFPVEDFEENSDSFALPASPASLSPFSQMTDVSTPLTTPPLTDPNLESPPPLPIQGISAPLPAATDTQNNQNVAVNENENSNKKLLWLALIPCFFIIFALSYFILFNGVEQKELSSESFKDDSSINAEHLEHNTERLNGEMIVKKPANLALNETASQLQKANQVAQASKTAPGSVQMLTKPRIVNKTTNENSNKANEITEISKNIKVSNPSSPSKEKESKENNLEGQFANKKDTNTPKASSKQISFEEGSCPRGMNKIRGGQFLWGSSAQDPMRGFGEKVHTGKNVNSYCIDYYEYPNSKKRIPTTSVSWSAAKNLCKKKGKRLCSEYEWEFACKGGKNRKFTYGNSFKQDYCNIKKEGAQLASAIDFIKCRSPLTIFMMNGNAAEWTADTYQNISGKVVIKGGSIENSASGSRCATRRGISKNSSSNDLGFRCCSDLK